MTGFQTTAVYVSGAICGPIWWPAGAKCGTLFKSRDLRDERKRFINSNRTFAEMLDHLLTENGGDFQHARFTSDTVIRIERRAVNGLGRYRVHVKEFELGNLPALADYVDAESYVCDFLGEGE